MLNCKDQFIASHFNGTLQKGTRGLNSTYRKAGISIFCNNAMDGAITPTKAYCNFIDGHSIDDQRQQEQFIVIELCDCCFDSKSH